MPRRLQRKRIVTIVGSYALLASLWIVLSDSLVRAGILDGAPGVLQTGKGLAFVAVSSLGLYLLIRWADGQIEHREAERQHSEHRLGLVFDSLRDHAIMLLDRDGCVVDSNPGTASVLGWERAELLGQPLSRFFLDEDVSEGEVARILDDASGGGQVVQDFRHRRRDGSHLWANVAVSRLAGPGGCAIGFTAVVRDVSERHRAQEVLRANELRLQESERRARLMMDSSIDGIIIIDERGTIEDFSGAAARIFGYAADEVVGRNVSVLMPEEYRVRHDGYLQRYLVSGERRVIGVGREVQGLTAEGRVFPMDIAVSEVLFESGQRRFIGTVRDLTERRETERQLRQAQKMEAVGQLTGGLAHDFNNLLSVTLGCAELLAENVRHGDQRSAKLCRTIIEAGERGAELTRRLLAFSRRQTLEPVEVDLAALVAGLDNLLSRTLGDDIEIATSLPAGLPRASADPAQVENALLNLAINGRDAMPDGGCLSISLDRARIDEDYWRHNPDSTVGDHLVLAVSDTGFGMPKEVLERACDPFFTTKPQGKGTGLGLSMVYGFARQSGGHLKIYSEVGHGTTVRLYLPEAPGDTAIASTAPAEATMPAGSETILVVEDDDLVRGYVSDQLHHLGYTVIAVGDGRSALAEIDSGRPIDVLFTDVVMPGGMNGRELSEEARRRRPGLRVLFTTGYTEDVMVLQGKVPEGALLLNKPYGRHLLARTLRSVIDAGAA